MSETFSASTHQARKRFGQHFLHDRHIISQLIHHIAPRPTDTLVEIGPGLGALTLPLLASLHQQCAQAELPHPMHVVELDRDLALRLRQNHGERELAVHEIDVLSFDFGQFSTPIRVVGNLPYNISTPILFALLPYADRVVDQTFMLQKEVIDRMVAPPGSKVYGRLSVMLQSRYEMRNLMRVPPGAFNPPPKVDSAVVRMRPLAQPMVPPELMAKFSQVVTTAFGQRRKMLRATLGARLQPQAFELCGVDPQARPEQLPPQDFVALAAYWRDLPGAVLA